MSMVDFTSVIRPASIVFSKSFTVFFHSNSPQSPSLHVLICDYPTDDLVLFGRRMFCLNVDCLL